MSRNKRILSISYDETLLTIRPMMLEQSGFDVVSAYGFAEASLICKTDPTFDLIVMGHSIPHSDKVALIGMLRPNCNAPLLSIQKAFEPPLTEAQFSVHSAQGPEGFLHAVRSALGQEATSPAVSSSQQIASSKKSRSRPAD